jgi:hypothetical protein
LFEACGLLLSATRKILGSHRDLSAARGEDVGYVRDREQRRLELRVSGAEISTDRLEHRLERLVDRFFDVARRQV